MLKQLISVFLESRCLFCSRTTSESLCQYCQQKLLSHQLKDRNISWNNLSVFAWGRYDGQLKRAIALMKYQNQPDIGGLLGKLLGDVWLHSGLIKPLAKITVVPIPLHSKKLKKRGFNQAEIIARSFCQITGYGLNSQALIRVRDTQAMFNLSLEERTKNLENAFQIGHKLPKHPVLLLDDIYTVGTTIKESAKILRQQRIEVIGAVVVAKSIISNQ
ncbi:ComF family protein [Pleurocapsa sp. PCC 7319]|uniref:ComF family protein n=1 Tax=Pleurocapsa sp. PCC 7319 TaxID=118161 RepID=UPI00034D24B8|nr:ComF family protein [Pleurocapsa sp. PCC 7319]